VGYAVSVKTQLRRLAEELGTTDRTLRRAVHQGLIRASRPSPRTVDISLAERSYLRWAWPFLSRMREVLRTEPTVSLAVLFGSRSRGEPPLGSDVDLLVRMHDDRDPRDVASRLSDKLGVRADVVPLDDALKAPLLIAEVVREGRVLVDRHGVWPSLVSERQRFDRAAARERRRASREFASTFAADNA
jgi:predicted nucleotidyltransferase